MDLFNCGFVAIFGSSISQIIFGINSKIISLLLLISDSATFRWKTIPTFWTCSLYSAQSIEESISREISRN